MKGLKTKDYFLSGQEFDLVWNPQWECFQTTPVPEDLEAFYKSAEYLSHSDRAGSFMEKIYQRVKARNLKRKLRVVERYQRERGLLMDVGAGTGEFVRHAQDHGWKAFGVEPNDRARELSHQKGLPVYKSLTREKNSVYDVITLWHVLEHMEDLDRGIREISATLKPGGWLIIALPNFRSLDARHYGSFWAAYDVPRHLWHLSRNSVRKIFLSRGYALVAVKPMWFDAFYISWLSEKYRKNPLAPAFGFLLGLISNFYGILSGEYSSQIYILRKEANPQ